MNPAPKTWLERKSQRLLEPFQMYSGAPTNGGVSSWIDRVMFVARSGLVSCAGALTRSRPADCRLSIQTSLVGPREIAPPERGEGLAEAAAMGTCVQEIWVETVGLAAVHGGGALLAFAGLQTTAIVPLQRS